MTSDEKLAAILAAVQTDPGNRGLARDPEDNLFTATRGDFQNGCQTLITSGLVRIYTGFFIPSVGCFETDGPLGSYFLRRTSNFFHCNWVIGDCEQSLKNAMMMAAKKIDFSDSITTCYEVRSKHHNCDIWIERSGPAHDGNHYTMRGIDTSNYLSRDLPGVVSNTRVWRSIGIGDGGNEIGMGKIPHETIVKNIPNGDLIHCRVPTDHLIVAGVSNWGAYALAAGIFVLKGIKPPPDLFDPDREKEILEVMVREGPLVDGVTGQQTATVDGLTWDEYVKPLIQIRDILES